MKENLNPGKELEIAAQKAANVLLEFDRMLNNNDVSGLQEKVTNQITNYGKVELCLFACPSYAPTALLGNKPEEYIQTEVKTPDLFTPRISKLLELRKRFQITGLPISFTIIIGDNDPQKYVLPILEKYGVRVDPRTLVTRQSLYKESFEVRARDMLGEGADIVSLLELDTESAPFLTEIPKDILKEEVNFLKWLFSVNGPYRGEFRLSEQDLCEMAEFKILNYAKQGFLVQNLTSGILLQTENPWLQRTRMLKLAGANIDVIYPWIRTEEIDQA